MANRKKRKPRRPTAAPPTGRAATPRSGGTNPERRERKELARQVREAARKRAQRSARVRRVTTIAAIGAIGVGVVFFLQRAASPRPVPQFAIDAAQAAGCSEVRTPAASAPGGQHLDPGQSYTYDEHPATSGFHDPSPLPIPPHVYTAPIQETNAVHNLEHGAAILYYRQAGDGALPRAIVDRLTTIADDSNNVILAPYAQLPDGTALALTAWNKLQTCPDTVTGPQARDIARGFIQAFVCTSNAPEGKLGQGC
ncbi:MAG: DUF3105 domain-containing protein [Actinomycetota bacterium]